MFTVAGGDVSPAGLGLSAGAATPAQAQGQAPASSISATRAINRNEPPVKASELTAEARWSTASSADLSGLAWVVTLAMAGTLDLRSLRELTDISPVSEVNGLDDIVGRIGTGGDDRPRQVR